MVTITFDIKTTPGKKQELLQALDELDPIIHREVGCSGLSISQPKLHTDMIIASEKWANAKDALRHFRSESFRVISGALIVLAQSSKMTISTELQTTSIDLKNQDLQKGIDLLIDNILS
jgi:quinol monooxygenase YgiN